MQRPRCRDGQKTQNGIETIRSLPFNKLCLCVATGRKPRTGLKQVARQRRNNLIACRDGQKTQNGIETDRVVASEELHAGRDGQKTQNGIETPIRII